MRNIFFLLFFVLSLATNGCSPRRSYTTIDGFAQGTTYHILYYDPQGRDLRAQVDSLLGRVDSSLSLYNPNSALSRLNAGDTTGLDNPLILSCVALARQISEDTDGAFDVTVRPLMAAYRIGTVDADGVNTPSVNELEAMRPYIGYRHLRIEHGRLVRDDPRVQIDLNAIAQGYTVDLIAARFDSLGLENYLIELGGEIFCRGHRPGGGPWRTGIDKPIDGNIVPGQALQAILPLTGGRGLVTSGNYRKFAYDQNGQKVVHTLDPRTLRPAVHNLLSATILAPSAALADGYATACMVLGLDGSKQLLARHPELEGYLIYAAPDGSLHVYTTPGLPLF